jgi:hypothetical protein
MAIASSNPPEILELQQFEGLNQESPRASIGDNEEWWNENLFAVGPGNLRSCWGPSAPIYQAPAGVTILRIFFGFYGKGTPTFGFPPPGRMGWMFLSNGNVDEVDLDTGAVTTLAGIWEPIAPYYWASAKVWRPAWVGNIAGEVGGVLFGSPLGLFAWDGTTLYRPGDPAPDWLTAADILLTGPFNMPTGLPGIYTMEVFQERLFVAGKNVIAFSAPQNGADFAATDGGGEFGYFGDKLVVSYMDLQASAGYLNVFGDSSTDIITNLQLSGSGTTESPYVTNFNYSNLDPQVGHAFPRPVGKWGRYFNTCNGQLLGVGGSAPIPTPDRGAIYLLVGGDYEQISDKVTGTWTSLDISSYYPTFACATMFGFRVQLLNGKFRDPFGVSRSLLLVWHGSGGLTEGSWSIASQNLELTNIGTYEEGSCLVPFGTDGTYLYRLFYQPDPALPKRLSTKSYRGQGANSLTIKNFKRTFLEVHDYSGRGASFTGQFTTRGGGIPNGSEDIWFELTAGQQHDIIPMPISGAGLSGEADLLSYSPDFSIERLQVMLEERTLYGA